MEVEVVEAEVGVAADREPHPADPAEASAWLDTSMTAAVTPRSSAAANSACRSVASGVVRTLSTTTSPNRVSTVPIRPVVRPAARSPDSIRYAVEVLPAVPVIPMTAAGRSGRRRPPRPGRAPRAVGDHERRQPGRGRGRRAGRVGEDRHRAGRDGAADELGAVPARAGQRGVEVAGPHLPLAWVTPVTVASGPATVGRRAGRQRGQPSTRGRSGDGDSRARRQTLPGRRAVRRPRRAAAHG